MIVAYVFPKFYDHVIVILMSLRLASALTRTRRLHKKRFFPDIQLGSTKGLTSTVILAFHVFEIRNKRSLLISSSRALMPAVSPQIETICIDPGNFFPALLFRKTHF